MTFIARIIHPTPAAEFDLPVVARSKFAARVVAYRKINDRFGDDTMYMVGNVKRAE